MATKLQYTPVKDIASTVDAARACFQSGRTKAIPWRKQQLQALRRLFTENEEAVKLAIQADLHRPDFEAVILETTMVVGEIDIALSEIYSWTSEESITTPLLLVPGSSCLHREPLGVALIIAPWNFPVQLLLMPMLAAIAAGNTVVLKPSEVAPACAKLIGELIPKYMDNDAIRVVQGAILETTEVLAQRFDVICYTGNSAVARTVMAAAAKNLTPVLLELGGKSPSIVDASANLDLAAKRIIANKCVNAGQMCVAPDYVLVEASVEAALVAKLKSTITGYFGADTQASPDLARIVNKRHFDRVSELLRTSGGTIVAGGKTDATDLFISPTLILRPDPNAPIMKEEIFGPLLPIIPVQNVQEAVQMVNKGEKPLALSIFSSRSSAKAYVRAHTSSGSIVENDCSVNLMNPYLPFGGVGNSGQSSYHGKFGFLAFSHTRAVFRQDTLLDILGLVRNPPYSPFKLALAKFLMNTLAALPTFPLGLKDTVIVALAAAVGVLAARVTGRL